MPEGIVDRPADVWEPLVMIGDFAGDDWAERIREAACFLNNKRAERDPSLGIRLLSDCRTVFNEAGVDRLPTTSVLSALIALDEAPWGDLRGNELDARGLAWRLRPYEVLPAQHRFGETTSKGYLLADFHDAWSLISPQGTETSETKETGDDVTDPTCPACAARAEYDQAFARYATALQGAPRRRRCAVRPRVVDLPRRTRPGVRATKPPNALRLAGHHENVPGPAQHAWSGLGRRGPSPDRRVRPLGRP